MTPTAAGAFKHVEHLWDDGAVAGLDPVERLVYRSSRLGSDGRMTNTGGGNTSSKIEQTDPLTGRTVDVLWVKGSGGDLRTSTRANFASLYLDRLLGLQEIYQRAGDRGPKTAAEDRMVSYYPHCTFDLNPRACSIDTPLHAFVPARHVDHTHPNAVIAVAASARAEELTREIYGDEVLWTPWQRPGFDLGLVLQEICRRRPDARGVVLGQHGLISWDDDDKACYELSLELTERAARFIADHDKGAMTFGGPRCDALPEARRDEVLVHVLPWLRGRLCGQRHLVATVQADATMLRFVNSVDAPRLAELGTSCPDHFLRTKIKPMLVDWDPGTGDVDALREALDCGLEGYRRDYAAYYEQCRRPDSAPMRDPSPTVILIPGIGMVAWGRSKSESRVTAEFYNCAVEVMRGAEAIDRYVALPAREAFDIEYWALEIAKLRRMPPDKPLAGRVAVVVGAGSGIGRAACGRVAAEGAHMVCGDLDGEAADGTAGTLIESHGVGIGVAGTGLSDCGPAISAAVDVTDRASVRDLLRRAVLAYGGVDHVVMSAGVYVAPDADGTVDDEHWRRTFDVNVKGGAVVAEEAAGIWRAQGLRGSLVLVTSVNAVVPKAGSLAYDTSKAAANHLVRELAVSLAPLVRVNGVAPATVVEGSSMFGRQRVLASLSRYGIEHDAGDDTETLRRRLAGFYAGRTLLGEPITPGEQSDAILFLLGDESSRTTGQVLTVDGGLPEAFLR